MANGTIKRLVRDRGFGFIKDDGGQEWFFHRSSVKAGSFDQLNEGQRVIFDEEPSQKGPRAGNIRAESEGRRVSRPRSALQMCVGRVLLFRRAADHQPPRPSL